MVLSLQKLPKGSQHPYLGHPEGLSNLENPKWESLGLLGLLSGRLLRSGVWGEGVFSLWYLPVDTRGR